LLVVDIALLCLYPARLRSRRSFVSARGMPRKQPTLTLAPCLGSKSIGNARDRKAFVGPCIAERFTGGSAASTR